MKRNIYLMYAIALLQGMVFYGPVATLYRQVHGVSVFQITLIESVSLLLCILLEVPWGVAADKIGYKRTFIFCCFLYFVSKIVFWKADGFILFLIERIMLSVVLAGISGVDTSILYLSCKNADSQRVFGIYNSMQMAGLFIASAVFSLFIKDNYLLTGFLTVISYGIAAVLSLCLIEVRGGETDRSGSEQFKTVFKVALKNRYLLIFLIAVALLSEVHQTITVFLNQLQYEKVGLNNAEIGTIYIIATLIGICGRFSAAFTNKLGVKFSCFFFSAVAAVSCLVLTMSNSAASSVLGILMLRMSDSLFQPFRTQIQNQQINLKNRATVLSIHEMLINSVAIGTNLIFGFLAEFNLETAFSFGVGICVLSMILFRLWYRNNR